MCSDKNFLELGMEIGLTYIRLWPAYTDCDLTHYSIWVNVQWSTSLSWMKSLWLTLKMNLI